MYRSAPADIVIVPAETVPPLLTVTTGSVPHWHGGNSAVWEACGQIANFPLGTLVALNVPSAAVVVNNKNGTGAVPALVGRNAIETVALFTGVPSLVVTVPVIVPEPAAF